MAQPRILVIGGGLAGLSATMRLAELGVHVDLVSLVPVKRSHSVCAQGGINSVNAVTRQQGDNEWKHFDDTVYGGDFLQHQCTIQYQHRRTTILSNDADPFLNFLFGQMCLRSAMKFILTLEKVEAFRTLNYRSGTKCPRDGTPSR